MRSYDVLGGGLEWLYLEDSYLLGFIADGPSLVFVVDAVQTEASPHFSKPAEGEQYCYRRIRIRFPSATAVVWHECTFRALVGPDGDIDFDNIDSFEKIAEDSYRLTGGWGVVTITSAAPVVEFINEVPE